MLYSKGFDLDFFLVSQIYSLLHHGNAGKATTFCNESVVACGGSLFELSRAQKRGMGVICATPFNAGLGVTGAKEDLKLVRERYSLGSATILEVLDAQVSLFRSNSTLINSIHSARILEANLKAILGSLDLEYKNKDK